MSNSAWPTTVDVANFVSAMNVTLTASTAVQTAVLNSTIAQFTRATLRQWIPIIETRYYDGSGTGEQEIDDFIHVDNVSILGFYGYLNAISLPTVAYPRVQGFPSNRIQINQGSLPGFYQIYISNFIRGRSNIAVTGTFGFDTVIPDDVWLGVAYQAAKQLVAMSIYKPDGFLSKASEVDSSESYRFMDPFKYFDSGFTFKSLIATYRRTPDFNFRRTAPVIM